MCSRFMFADVCPGCQTPLISGAIADAIEKSQKHDRVFGLTPLVALDECDAIYIGDLVVSGVNRCPRCGANCVVPAPEPVAHPDRGDDRSFLEELIIDLDLSVRARNVINRAGARTVGDLVRLSPRVLRSFATGCRELEIAEIREFLKLRGLSLKNDG